MISMGREGEDSNPPCRYPDEDDPAWSPRPLSVWGSLTNLVSQKRHRPAPNAFVTSIDRVLHCNFLLGNIRLRSCRCMRFCLSPLQFSSLGSFLSRRPLLRYLR